MFFKNIEEWSYSKVKKMWLLFGIAYWFLSVGVPVIIIACNYALFEKEGGIKLTAIGLIVAVILGVVLFHNTKKLINKLPDNNYKERNIKFICEMIYEIALPVFLMVCLYSLKRSFDVGYKTLWWCCVSFIGGIIVNNLSLKHIDVIKDAYREAEHLQLVNKLGANLK